MCYINSLTSCIVRQLPHVDSHRATHQLHGEVTHAQLTELADDCLLQLHSADIIAVMWLRDLKMKALMK